ncbi:MAG: hypothetical protein A4E29_00684 [Methanomassiliicoccales archaeon PtaB.Bin134]|nr:MAG: hypothetical protein A4E29_00684 [Methanomassiliicoccales archaeon PtaB.Bin134]
MLRGELVGLVPLQSTDELALNRWLNDPRVRRASGRPSWKACYNLEQVQDIIRDRLAQPSRYDLIVTETSGGQPLGMVEITHLHPMRDSAQITMVWGEKEDLEKEVEALALAVTYAFNSQGLHRLWARVPSAQQGMVDAFQQVGFRVEGVLREDHFSGGIWRDSLLLSLLSAEARPC